MSKTSEKQNDEIDLIDIFLILWKRKLLICFCTVFFTLIGSVYIYTKEVIYESKIVYTTLDLPRFFYGSKIKAFYDYKKTFYTKNIFNEWKENNKNISINFEDFSLTDSANGFMFTRDDRTLAKLVNDKNSGTITVYTNKDTYLNQLHKYANHINDLLTSKYNSMARKDIKILEKRYPGKVLGEVIKAERYFLFINEGGKAFDLQPPTIPKKIPQNTLNIIVTFLILGFVFGIIVTISINFGTIIKQRI